MRTIVKRVTFCILGLVLAIGIVQAAEVKWPTKTVTVTMPYNAGGDTDTYCRLMSKMLSEKFGETFVVVNMPGGGGLVSAKTVMATKPDGYNILFNHTSASLMSEATGMADFSFTDDFTNVATVCQDNTYTLICKKGTWNTLEELIAYAKANPGKVRYSIVYGSTHQYLGSLVEELMGIQLNSLDVGNDTSERFAAFLGDQVDILFVNYMNIDDYVEKGDVIPLGCTSPERIPGMEKVKTLREQGYDIVCSKNYEVKFPKGTDAAIVAKLSSALEEIAKSKEFEETLRKYYAVPFYRNAETMAKEDKAEVERLKKYITK
ncbi:MAG: tripartite tricarboxylate transporter substrate binding protein [Fusobacteriaceae bacterium]|nr:tripartite tricarboxylate transporter substrate binding protein [Fusobacteriaceae bacterium]